ncbi:aminoglycoside phosphotransferase family protein [Nocardioides sp. SYSU DS0651]|uniref:aminoglycoside phosphotransferase family protein n=1 Tax=Nocardioides sp. SYSU DS0651 TaxID=3415955 RepID=UPI003F4C166C
MAPLPALLEEWELTADGEPWRARESVVLPVRTRAGEPAALKLGRPDEDSAHEHLALQHWHGAGAVLLLRADPRRRALLLERLADEDLAGTGDVAACEVVGDLYRRLHRPAPPQLRRLSDHAARVADRLDALPGGAPLPPRFVDQARALARSFAEDPETDGVLVHADLHYGNVLAGSREPWLAIDPKPLSGDPHFEVAPLLWTRYDELGGQVRDGLRARFHAAVDAAGLDERRARDWVVVRTLDLARRLLERQEAAPRGPRTGDWLTRCVSIAKAVQD